MKNVLLRALDEIIADLREATIAIQRDDFDVALGRLRSADDRIRKTSEELQA